MSCGRSKRILLHAPNIHTGGGLTLLNELLSANDPSICWMQLDLRSIGALAPDKKCRVFYVKASIVSRWFAEVRLWFTSKEGDVILCFHSLPPLFPVAGKVVVFVQNKLLVENTTLKEYPLATRLRVFVERCWGKLLQSRCVHYIVQTPSMRDALVRWLENDARISMVPFTSQMLATKVVEEIYDFPSYDFVYVASGEAHKNHLKLIDAWCLLAKDGFRPSLAVTLSQSKYSSLCEYMAKAKVVYGLSIINLGVLEPGAVHLLYKSAKAVIYPSKTESFGLPLVEARAYNLSILASELDYVRDIVDPVETFNPDSELSIARAVKRYLKIPNNIIRIEEISKFIMEVLR